MADTRIENAIQAALIEGRLSCKRAFELADELSVPVGRIGATCEALGVKIVNCQLGCFGTRRRKKESGGSA